MNDDDDLCLCFHVSRRKVVQFIRAEKPKVTSQLSECYGAGTGCGWCRPFLERLMNEADPQQAELPDAESYAAQRKVYRDKLS
ncbi:MAG: (2Fe-2S)-binding protein [Pirellulaceae bacterium]|nr:(2Fe-2S)-binding protein [Pirellulaceae bacterium]